MDFEDPTTWDEKVTEDEALGIAILAINTLLYPDATSDAQFDALQFHAESVIETLANMRDSK